MLAIALLPAAFTNTFGRMVGQPRQGWLLYGVMLLLFVCGVVFVHHFEQRGFPQMGNVDSRQSRLQSGGNMEGKEERFGIGSSALTAVVTSNTATGSNNSMDDSYTSLGGMVLLVNMLLGGLGTGLYSMVMAAAIAVFLAGLMVGRTPEYLGKKIGPAENKMIMLYALAAPLVILPLTAIALSTCGTGRAAAIPAATILIHWRHSLSATEDGGGAAAPRTGLSGTILSVLLRESGKLPFYRDAFRVLVLRRSGDEIARTNGWQFHIDEIH
jgi:K+-transporting ATPase A subunit